MKINVWTMGYQERQYARGIKFIHNSLILSCSLGSSSYSDGKSYDPVGIETANEFQNKTMEVAIIKSNGDFVQLRNDFVIGYISANKLVSLLTALSSEDSESDRIEKLKSLLLAK